MAERRIREVRWLTDDRDKRNRQEYSIRSSDNGDWYVASTPEGQGTAGRAVRISTSGGASFAVPGLTKAIKAAFDALANAKGDGITHIYDE